MVHAVRHVRLRALRVTAVGAVHLSPPLGALRRRVCRGSRRGGSPPNTNDHPYRSASVCPNASSSTNVREQRVRDRVSVDAERRELDLVDGALRHRRDTPTRTRRPSRTCRRGSRRASPVVTRCRARQKVRPREHRPRGPGRVHSTRRSRAAAYCRARSEASGRFGGRVQRFWSRLAVQLGKHAIARLGGRADHHRGLGFGITKLEVLDRPGQLPQQERPGLQGQRRVPEAVRRRGDGHARHDGHGPHGRRALHAREHRAVEGGREARCADSGQVVNVVSPLTALAVERHARARARPAIPTQSVAGKILLADVARETRRPPARPRAAPTPATTLHAHQRRSPSPSARSTTPSTSTSCSTTTRATSASRCSRSSPTPATRRWSRGSRQRVDQGRGRRRRLRAGRRGQAALRRTRRSRRPARRCSSRTSTTTSPAGC